MASLIFAAAAVAMACNTPSGLGNQNPPPADSVAVVGVKVTPQSIQLLAIGETKQLVVTVVPANATDKAIIWESTDSTVATVSASGLVTAIAPGAAVFVTAYTHDGHFQYSVNVTVEP